MHQSTEGDEAADLPSPADTHQVIQIGGSAAAYIPLPTLHPRPKRRQSGPAETAGSSPAGAPQRPHSRAWGAGAARPADPGERMSSARARRAPSLVAAPRLSSLRIVSATRDPRQVHLCQTWENAKGKSALGPAFAGPRGPEAWGGCLPGKRNLRQQGRVAAASREDNPPQAPPRCPPRSACSGTVLPLCISRPGRGRSMEGGAWGGGGWGRTASWEM